MRATITAVGNIAMPGDIIQLKAGSRKPGLKVRVLDASRTEIEFDAEDLALNRKARRAKRSNRG